MKRALTACLGLLLVSGAASGGDRVRASLEVEPLWVQPGVPFTAAVRLQIRPGWHVYWQNPGDSGLAPRLSWRLLEGVSAGPTQWPVPSRLAKGPLVDQVLAGDVWLLTALLPAPSLGPGQLLLAVDAEWLACAEECIPERAALTLPVRVVQAPSPPGPEGPAFAAARLRLPRRLPLRTRLAPETVDGRPALRVEVLQGGPELPLVSATFFPDRPGLLAQASEQLPQPIAGGFALTLALAAGRHEAPELLTGVLLLRGSTPGDEVALALSARTAPPPLRPRPLGAGLALLFALLGGLLLNLMPCVLPVLAVKALGLLQRGGGSLTHGLVHAAGVICSFWLLWLLLLSLRASGRELGWGFQLQSPRLVAALALLFFALGLSLLGRGESALRLQSAASVLRPGAGLSGSFLSGVLSTAVATPCTAPFMGAALGEALVAPPWLAFGIFTLLGLGLALPLLLLSRFPRLLPHLPRPGPWMLWLRQLLAFPLFATALWLCSVLVSEERGDRLLRLLLGVFLVGLALWLRGQLAGEAVSRRGRLLGDGAALLLLGAGFLQAAGGPSLGRPTREPGEAQPDAPATAGSAAGEPVWLDWSEERVALLRAEGRPLLVDFTAAWCITCQVNDRLVFSSREVRERVARQGVVLLRADWTRSDPAITRALAAFGRSGVPLTVLYGTGEPLVLPTVLGPGAVLEALGQLR